MFQIFPLTLHAIMKQNLLFLLVASCLATFTTGTMSAKKTVAPKMYMFGMAASFNDSIVHFTDIQEVDSAWIDSKNSFLLGRDSYSYQLRAHLSDALQMPHRTCIVVYNAKRDKLEKKYQKMLCLYTTPKKKESQHFDVRMLERGTFHFEAVDMSDAPDEEEAVVVNTKKAKKGKKGAEPAEQPAATAPAAATTTNE